MPRTIQAEGKLHQFPDDATDAEISAVLNPVATPPEGLNPMSESTLSTAAAQLTGRGGFWEGLKAGGRVIGEKGAELFDKTGIGPMLQGLQPAAPGGYAKDPTVGVTESREVGGTLGELLTPDPLMVAGVGAGTGKVGQVIRSLGKDIALGTGKGLENAGKILGRAKAGVSGDLTNPPGTAAGTGLARRGIDPPGAKGGMRAADDPLTAIDRNKMGRELSTGAIVRPSSEGGPIVLKSTPKAPPEPKPTPTGRPGEIIDPYKRDYSDLKVTTKPKGPTQGQTPLPVGELRTTKQIVGAGDDIQPSIVASQPPRPGDALPLPTAPLDEVSQRLQAAHGLAPRDPRLVGLVEALDVAPVKDKTAALRGTIGALLGNARAAGAETGEEDDDVLTRRIVYTLLGLGLGVAAFPVGRRVLAAWRGRPMPKITIPNQPSMLGTKGVAPQPGDLKSAAQIAQETYGSMPRPKPSPQIEQALLAAPPPPAPATMIPILDLDTGGKVAKFAESLFVQNKFKYVPGDVPLTDQMLDIIKNGYAGPASINQALKEASMTHAELMNVLGLERGSVAESARKLAKWSVAAKNIQKALMTDPVARRSVSVLDRVAWSAHDFMYNTMALWRGALTSQLATGLRNVYVSGGRTAFAQSDALIDWTLRKVSGKTTNVDPLEGLHMWGRVFQYGKSKKATEEILSMHPGEWKKLYGDILEAQEAARNSNVGQAVGLMNWHNAFQEKVTRNVAFQTVLDREMSLRGMDLVEVLKRGEAGSIPPDAIKAAVDEALRFTYAKNPDYGTGWSHFVSLMHQWWAVPFVPFPRFMYNAWKFHMEYSPLGLLPALRSGSTRDYAKQLTGMVSLTAAYGIRSSNVAGEKWYQVKVGERTIDIRPFNPMAAHFFMAEFARRVVNGERPMLGRELVEGLLGLNLRAGTGLAIMDQFVDAISSYGWQDEWQWNKAMRGFGEVAGEWIGGFATPFQQLQDFADAFIDEPYKPERKGNILTDPFKARLPGAQLMLPPAVNPLHDETPMRQATIARLLGVTVEGPRTAAEKAYQKHGMGPGLVMPRTGINEWDRHMAGYMAKMVDAVVNPFVQTPNYTNLSHAQQALALRQVTAAAREIAVYFAINAKPVLAGQAKMQTMPALERRVLLELFGPEVVNNPAHIEVVRFLRSNLPNYAAFLKDLVKVAK